MRVVSELIAHGEVTPILLGLDFKALDPALHAVLEVPVGRPGVLISGVQPGSPAERGGLLAGDVMLGIDGRDLAGAKDVLDYLNTLLVGSEVEVEIWRDGASKLQRVRTEEIPSEQVQLLARDYLGLSLTQLDEGSETGGFRVTSVTSGSRAEQIGFRVGDHLLALNGRRLRGGDDLRRAIVELRGRRRAVVVVQRGSGRYHVTIPLV